MAGYKLDNLKVLTENNAVGNVVTAGFWESDAIATLLAADPQRLIIFEPDSALYAAASAQYADNSNLEVRNATLANNTGQTDYFVFKPSRFSSLLKPAKLLKVYKKNNNDNVVSINVSTVQHVCEQEKILPYAGNILLLGVNCPSTILSDAAQTGHLSYFDVIVVRQPKQGLYETEQQQQETLSSVLQEPQFTCAQEIAGDAMYTQFVYVRDHQREKLSALQAKVTEAETRNAEISKKLAESEASASRSESRLVDLTTLHSQYDTKLAEIKLQNDKLSAEHAQQLTEKEELAAHVAALQNKQNELVDAQKDKDTQIAELTAQRDQQATDHQEIRRQIEALKAQNTKISTENAQQLTEKEELAAHVAALQEKQSELVVGQKDKDTQITELTAQRDQQAADNQEIRQQTEALKVESEILRVNNTAQKQELDEELSQSQIKIRNLETNNAALRANLTEYENKASEQNALLESRLNDKEKKLAEQQEYNSAIKQELDIANKSLHEAQDQFEVLNGQYDEITIQKNELEQHLNNITKEATDQTHWRHENKKWAETLKMQCEQLKVYSADRQKSADLALKLQTKAQVDLENLREKYQHKHINEQKLVALISELRAKLQQAAEYYYELQEKHPELHEITQSQVEPSNVEEYQTANFAELDNETRPAKGKSRGIKTKSVTRGNS